MRDPLDAVREMAPPVETHPDLLERVRSELLTRLTQSETPDPQLSDLWTPWADHFDMYADATESTFPEPDADDVTDQFLPLPNQTTAR